MNINIVGSGNVATNISQNFVDKGHRILSIYSRKFKNASDLASVVDAVPVEDINSLDKRADLIIISVKDDKIEEISDLIDLDIPVVHTAGSVDINVLKKHKKHGVFYPLQTFNKRRKISLKQVPICIEANNSDTLNQLSDLANSVSESIYFIDSGGRLKLHVAAVFSCNFVNHLYSIAENILEEEGIPFEIIKPLIDETAQKIMNSKPTDVQTGPAKRRDFKTMVRHQEILKQMPKVNDLYKSISENIMSVHKLET